MVLIQGRKQTAAIYVDRSCQQWIVRDPTGKFWIVPSAENAWDQRQPFTPGEETVLEIVPGHYKYMFDLPF